MAADFDVASFVSSDVTTWPGAIGYQIVIGGEPLTTSAGVPILSEAPTYLDGQSWTATSGGTFQTLTVAPGDLLVAHHPLGATGVRTAFVDVVWTIGNTSTVLDRVPIFTTYTPAELPFVTEVV